jgi:hypothetical protein
MGSISRWKDAAKKSILGPEIALVEIKPEEDVLKEWKEAGRSWVGYWVKPKKYSIKGKFKVDGLAMGAADSIPPSVSKKIAKIYADNPDLDTDDTAAILDLLDGDDLDAIITAQLKAEDNSSIVKAIIEEGLGETNLLGEGETVTDFADQVLEYSTVADEIVKIIRDYNRPLQERKSSKSSKPQEMLTEA